MTLNTDKKRDQLHFHTVLHIHTVVLIEANSRFVFPLFNVERTSSRVDTSRFGWIGCYYFCVCFFVSYTLTPLSCIGRLSLIFRHCAGIFAIDTHWQTH